MTISKLECGLLVESLAGHDIHEVFVITEIVDDDYVLIANGKSRRLFKPKRKKTKHIKVLNAKIDLDALSKNGGLTDGDLRRAIGENLNKIGG